MAKHGKRYLDSLKQFDPEKQYAPLEAFTLLKQVAKAKFDQTVDIHMRLGVDPRHAEQQVRGGVAMPAGLGKTVRILVFAEGEAEKAARDAGADIVGGDELIT